MQFTIEYMRLQKIIPNLTFGESEAICYYWRVYWENPVKYAWLKETIVEWLRNGDGKAIAKRYDEGRW